MERRTSRTGLLCPSGEDCPRAWIGEFLGRTRFIAFLFPVFVFVFVFMFSGLVGYCCRCRPARLACVRLKLPHCPFSAPPRASRCNGYAWNFVFSSCGCEYESCLVGFF